MDARTFQYILNIFQTYMLTFYTVNKDIFNNEESKIQHLNALLLLKKKKNETSQSRNEKDRLEKSWRN